VQWRLAQDFSLTLQFDKIPFNLTGFAWANNGGISDAMKVL
jgi:hypothetical protein